MEERQETEPMSKSQEQEVETSPPRLPLYRRQELVDESPKTASLAPASPIDTLPSIQSARSTSVDLFAMFSARLREHLVSQPAGLNPLLRALPVVDVIGQWQRQSIRLLELETRFDDATSKSRRRRGADAEEQEFVT